MNMATVSAVPISFFPAKFHLNNLPCNQFSYPSILNLKQNVQFQYCVVTDKTMESAHQVFDDMPKRNEDKTFSQDLTFVHEMMNEGFGFNKAMSFSLLKESFDVGGIDLGLLFHGWCIRLGLGYDTRIRTSLIAMYSRFGMLDDACLVFNETSVSHIDDFSFWDSIIAAFIINKCYNDAFRVFIKMLSFGMAAPTELIYVRIISACACASARESKYGAMIHGRIIKEGIVEATNVYNSLVTFYTKCGNLKDAKKLFEKIEMKNVISWNAIIGAAEQNGEEENALKLFYRMVRAKPLLQPNQITFLSALSAVSGLIAINHGREIHSMIIKSGLRFDTRIPNSLINMYSKCRNVDKAKIIFDMMDFKDVITWNSMLSGYEQNHQQENCFSLFEKMLLSGITPDYHTYAILINAAASSNPRRGLSIHGYILKKMVHIEMSLFLSNVLITMYAKLNRVKYAEYIFKGMKKRDLYSWNSMMDGYSSNGQFEKALKMFFNTINQGMPLDHLSFSILITVCGRLASLELGKQFHCFTMKFFYDPNHEKSNSHLSIDNALISMYSKCGSIADASRVFTKMGKRDVISWTALITGYAHHGMPLESFKLYKTMKKDGVKPNHVTFLGLLLACAHGGLVQEGTHYFQSMTKDYKLDPNIDHYACMIDLFGRSGDFNRAKTLVEQGITLFGENSNLWRALLGACHAHSEFKLGVESSTRILALDPEDEATLVILANLYACSGLWQDAIKVRAKMRSKGIKKEVGSSWLDVKNTRHSFVAGDIKHPMRKEIYENLMKLDSKLRSVGYVPITKFLPHDVAEKEKEEITRCHSEKLAVSFGLIQRKIKNNCEIRVIKNLRVCRDCHSWMKFTSKVETVEIVMRDSRRFHHFTNGICSCGDFW